MCGVAFAYRPDLEPDTLSACMEQAVRSMQHRGPDGSGVAGRPPWSIGHRRLAVIDPSGSHQPMVDPSGRYRQVVELAFALPLHWHRIGWSGKRMLRRSFCEVLPPHVWNRPKQGFAVPLNQWFRKGLQSTLNDMLNHMDNPINKHFVQRMIAAHLDRRCNNGHRLWQLYIYLRWRLTQPWLTS
jgi:asparagine synthetase B (glutamine-hydrolysing)